MAHIALFCRPSIILGQHVSICLHPADEFSTVGTIYCSVSRAQLVITTWPASLSTAKGRVNVLRMLVNTIAIRARPHQQRGFTILELMIAIAIAAILLALAVPSFTSFLNSNRATSQANELLASFQIARMEAIRRNAPVIVCGSDNAESGAPTCSGNATWGGWVVFADANANGVIDAAEIIKLNALAAPIEADASGNIANRVVYRSDGFARTAAGALLEGTVAVCVPTADPPENARDVRIDAGSRVGVAKRNGGGNCNAPAD